MSYAKSEPIETIKEHTDKLLNNLKILQNTYGKKITKVINMNSKDFGNL